MSALLEVKNLKKYFKTPKGMLHAVDDVSFTLDSKTTLGVVGESGCGKSTLGRTILHLLDSTGGNVIFNGEDITNVNRQKLKALRNDMQIVFQDPFSSLNPRLSVSQIIAEPMEIYHTYKSRRDRMREVEALMDTVGLTRRLMGAYPHELDGGRRQRIGIARALALNPKFIVCDEPVSALDVSIQAQILNLMQDLQQERDLTYLFITHNLSVVKHISQNIMVMYLGKVVEYSPVDELFASPTHPYTRALLSAIPVPEVGAKKEKIILRGEISSPIEPKPGCRFAPRCLFAKDICTCQEPPMHEVAGGHTVSCHFAKDMYK